jgi:hypothetical protein
VANFGREAGVHLAISYENTNAIDEIRSFLGEPRRDGTTGTIEPLKPVAGVIANGGSWGQQISGANLEYFLGNATLVITQYDIAGTPAATDLFLMFNGFRKSPIITTTANTRSASGSLADTDFKATTMLMGTAGIVGSDKQRVAFILDPNTYNKALELASVKTQDVFSGATLEDGELTRIWGYEVIRSYFMHYRQPSRLAEVTGKVDLDTAGDNTTGAILAVRFDQWLLGYRRRMTIETQRIIDADATQIVALMRLGLAQRDTEASAITYNVGV